MLNKLVNKGRGLILKVELAEKCVNILLVIE
jgi:hypothetical protein